MTFPPNPRPPLNGNRLELPRKLFHLSGLLLLLVPRFFGPKAKVIFLALACLVSVIEFLRLKSPAVARVLEKVFARLMRPEEHQRPSGSFYFFWGVALSFLFFGSFCATLGLLVLAIADPLASLVGTAIGRHRFLRKSLEGTVAFFLMSLLIFYLTGFAFKSALFLALLSAFLENLSPVNDNFILPLGVSAMCHLI